MVFRLCPISGRRIIMRSPLNRQKLSTYEMDIYFLDIPCEGDGASVDDVEL